MSFINGLGELERPRGNCLFARCVTHARLFLFEIWSNFNKFGLMTRGCRRAGSVECITIIIIIIIINEFV